MTKRSGASTPTKKGTNDGTNVFGKASGPYSDGGVGVKQSGGTPGEPVVADEKGTGYKGT